MKTNPNLVTMLKHVPNFTDHRLPVLGMTLAPGPLVDTARIVVCQPVLPLARAVVPFPVAVVTAYTSFHTEIDVAVVVVVMVVVPQLPGTDIESDVQVLHSAALQAHVLDWKESLVDSQERCAPRAPG